MSRILPLAATLVAFAAPVSAQESVDLNVIARIKAEGLERSRVLELYSHLTNVIGPRLPASPGYKQSADWARARFAEWGLANAHFETFDFGRGWSLDKLTLEMTAPRYFPLIGYPEAWTPSTRGLIEGTPVYVGDRSVEQVRAMGERLRGAIVLLLPPQPGFLLQDRPQPADSDARVRIGAPPSVQNQGVARTQDLTPVLRELGAAAVLRPSQAAHGTVFVLGNRNTQNDAVPSIVLAAEHYNLMVRLLQSGASPRVRLEVQTRYHEQDRNGYNIIAEIPGTDPQLRDEIVLVGAHLDSWHSSSGATDNADGSAEIMEAARILKAIGAQPRRTIRFALWDAEEQGLLGSRAYANQHLAGDANAANRQKFYVYFNDDPGAGAIYGWYLEENNAIKPVFDAWLEPLRDLGARRNVIDKIGSTDHLAFTALGLPAFNTVKDYVDYDVRSRHSNTDFYERVREQDLKQSAIVLATFAWLAATRREPLPRPTT
jgi:hypothetical protein